ncbi:MAG: RnfH family protein [Rhodoferax sp.]|jgi:putative ubiquitin-RnfH superfamily antitoxin RatB of RatAB toxin-antitoxin module|nr:RnfH family protein [Rhodoferax sp.]MBP9060786.1 RnfH family protein [Rhodoferax sp.]MBP9683474.1 RnfH family protein [Rhodoferax sp.]
MHSSSVPGRFTVNDIEIRVTVVYSDTARHVEEMNLRMAPHSTVLQAIEASGFLQLFPAIDISEAVVGVWGRKAGLRQLLRDRDRVEIYRPLIVDPKEARRTRFAKQGARTTGLFAKIRRGAKTGY